MKKTFASQYSFVIITPSYNQANFIEQTIKSVLKQQFHVTYIVMDGKSSDNTLQILKKYSLSILWKSQKDRGQTDAINQGIKLAKKNVKKRDKVIFAYINSDDYYLSRAFEEVVKAFQQHPDVNWLVGDALIVDEHNRSIQSLIKIYKKILRLVYQPWLLGILNPFPQPATFIRWSSLLKIGDFDQNLKYVMDYEYWLRLQNKYGRPLILDQELAAFRIHGQSKGGSQYLKQFEEQYLVAQRYVSNSAILMMHRLHNWLTITIYRMIK